MPEEKEHTPTEPAWRSRWRRGALILMIVSFVPLIVTLAIPELANSVTIQIAFALVVIGFPLGALVAYALRPRRR